MHTTPPSLLERLASPDEGPAWEMFVELYTPLLFEWSRRWGLQEADAADLVQETLLLLYRRLPEFRYQPGGSFRGWLRTVLLNKWREKHRRPALPVADDHQLDELHQPDSNPEREELEYRQQLLRVMLRKIRPEFSQKAWEAFVEYVLEGKSPVEVADRRRMSPATVYATKSKVLLRLRQELNGLMD